MSISMKLPTKAKLPKSEEEMLSYPYESHDGKIIHFCNFCDLLGPHDTGECPREGFLLDNKIAIVSAQAFKALKDYSRSLPTGAFPGKIWKRQCPDGWVLGMYTEHEDPSKVSIEWRTLIVV